MAKKRRLKKKSKKALLLIVCIALFFVTADTVRYVYLSNKKFTPVEHHEEDYYYAYDFGFLDKKSDTDYNNNGKDDYTDILIGLKEFAKKNPQYTNKYYAGGYPDEGEGVCTDTVWFAIDNAGYNLKNMIDKDIEENKEEYNIEIIDQNIDFRRVGNQQIFFEKYVKSLTTDIEEVMEFNPGDILTFNGDEHIAMVSDKRNIKGIPYLIQNRDETQEEKEEDRLEITDMKVTGHYRFTYNKKLEKLIKSL